MPSGEILKVGGFILIRAPNAESSWPLGPQLWARHLKFNFCQGIRIFNFTVTLTILGHFLWFTSF
jgi:hypothetical protein